MTSGCKTYCSQNPGFTVLTFCAFIFCIRDDVYQAMLFVNPEAVRRRKDAVLRRREYVSVVIFILPANFHLSYNVKVTVQFKCLWYVQGSNWIWHIDGHDKMKPYGFAIHGCIDGFSRKILWCHVDATNNDPKYIAKYYYDFVKFSKGIVI